MPKQGMLNLYKHMHHGIIPPCVDFLEMNGGKSLYGGTKLNNHKEGVSYH